MKRIYQLFLGIGQKPNYSLLENKKIKLLNIYVLITIHFVVIMPIGDTITGIVTSQILGVYCIMFLFMILIMFLNKFHQYYLATTLWLSIVLFAVFMFSVVLLPEKYTEYYYVFVPGISLTLFSKNIISTLITIFSLFLFFIPYYIIVVYPPSIVNNLDVFSVLGIFICVYLLVNYFKKINNENEKKLNELYKELQETKKNELASMQLKFLKGRMNPHFMFNTMNSVQNLMIRGKTNETYRYLSNFSSIIRDHLNSTEKTYITFGDEFSLINKYLTLEKLRFNNEGEYRLEKGNVLSSIQIPSMLIQPFIDNSIYRMFHNINRKNKLSIQFNQTDLLTCEIFDNGIGFKETELIVKKNSLNQSLFLSKNLNKIKEHLKLLDDLYNIKVNFEYVFLDDKTKCIISIPYKTHI